MPLADYKLELCQTTELLTGPSKQCVGIDETAETLPRKLFTFTNINTIRIPAIIVPKTGTIPATIRGAKKTVLLFKLELCITSYQQAQVVKV